MTAVDLASHLVPEQFAPTRLLLGIRADGAPLSRAEHEQVHGRINQPLAADAIIAVAVEAGLRGRGGGGYLLANKLKSVRGSVGLAKRPIVVVNAAESEPASRKDAILLTRSPHLVLDGAELAALAVGARTIMVWVHRGDVTKRTTVERAIIERMARPLTKVRYQLVEGPARYVAGEASALASHLSGAEAKPRMGPPRLAQRGVADKPTLVSNAETLAHLALAIRHGASWFRGLGTTDEPGTMLCTVLGAVRIPGVVEAAVGTPLADLIGAAGGVTSRPAAVLLGGYAGTWLTTEQASALRYSADSLATVSGVPGVGLLAVLPQGACPVVETARLVAWLAGESAGQCGPCVNGLPALAGAAQSLALGRGAAAVAGPALLARWSAMVTGRGACHHPDGVAGLVGSLLRNFPAEVAAHATGAGCTGTDEPSVLPLPAVELGGPTWR